MIYLAEAQIRKSLYEGEETIFPHRTIVVADTTDQAEEKYRSYWDARTEEYCVYYDVASLTLNEAIC